MTDPVRTFGAPGAPKAVDPDLDPDLAPVDASSDLEDLRRELAADVADTIELEVPGRPGWSAVYSTALSGEQLDTFRKRARDRKYADGFDPIRFAGLVLVTTNTALRRKGEDVVLAGEVATLRNPDLLELLGASGAVDGARRLYGLDGQVDAAARAVMAAAGWGDEATAADPT